MSPHAVVISAGEFTVTPTQPLRAPSLAASPTPPSRREESRLLRLWIQLTYRAASAAAHSSQEETLLRTSQLQVEEALLERFPRCRPLMDELIVWESGLLHDGDGVPVSACLLCRRASLDLPAGLPLPAATAGGPR